MHLELKDTVTKLMTGDLKKKLLDSISQWYDEASDEIDRDLSLDLSVLELESASKVSSVSHPSAIKEEE